MIRALLASAVVILVTGLSGCIDFGPGIGYTLNGEDRLVSGLPIEFRTSENKEFDWSFGDGGTDRGIAVSHTYAHGGVYEVYANSSLLPLHLSIWVWDVTELDGDAPLRTPLDPGTTSTHPFPVFDGAEVVELEIESEPLPPGTGFRVQIVDEQGDAVMDWGYTSSAHLKMEPGPPGGDYELRVWLELMPQAVDALAPATEVHYQGFLRIG